MFVRSKRGRDGGTSTSVNKSVETVLLITAALIGLDDQTQLRKNHSVPLVEEMATVAYSDRT
jgi:hypothetical protein